MTNYEKCEYIHSQLQELLKLIEEVREDYIKNSKE